MVTAEELVVAIRSEGIGETREGLESVEDSMEETAETAGESAEELSDFSERFKGAMGAAVAALAVGAAGLLSQVPVLGELFAGLSAIVAALAFQMDGVLRPVLSPITQGMFKLSNAIFEQKGVWGDIIGIVATVVSILAVAIPAIAAVGAQLGVWASTGAGVIAILGKIAGGAAFLISLLEPVSTAILLIIAASALLAAAWANNWLGIRDITDSVVSWIMDTVVGGFKSLANRAIQGLKSFGSDTREFFAGLASDIASWAGDVADDARDWGANLIEKFIAGVKSALARLRRFLQDLREVGAKVGIDVPDLPGFGGGGGGGGGGGANGRGGMPGTGAGGFTMDGRKMSESTGRYRSDPANRRGL